MDTVVEAFVEERPICYGVDGASSGTDTFHLNVLIPDDNHNKVTMEGGMSHVLEWFPIRSHEP